MLRPATPLTVLLFASFLLLLLSVISTPVIQGIPIASLQDVNFGVFGYCSPEECSGVRVGYTTDELFDNSNADDNFSLPSSARHSLSSLLVVHPIAAFLNLICLGLAGAAHLHSPSHSARYLLALLVLLLPTLLVTLLAFLVDVLLFVPHLQWGGWIVLASTILITASGVVTCAMRRTLVSRKARKKRIAQNAEMSGENFYSRQNTLPKIDASSPRTSTEPKMPVVTDAPGSNTLPAFSPYHKEHEVSEGRSDFSRRSPPNRMNGGMAGYRGGNEEALGPGRSRGHDQYGGARDEYGIPVPSPNALGAAAGPPPNLHRDPSDPTLKQSASPERMNTLPPGSRGGLGYGGPSGRGGYPTRGGYGPPRGGFGGPRGPNRGFGRGGSNDGRGIYNNGRGRVAALAGEVGGGMAAGGLTGRPQQGPPPGYPPQGQTASQQDSARDDLGRVPLQGYGGASGGPRQQSPGGLMRGPSPNVAPPIPSNDPSVGQAVEMDAVTGRISQTAAKPHEGALAHNLSHVPPNQASLGNEHPYSASGATGPPNVPQVHGPASPSSTYSHAPDAYFPPRAAWTNNSRAGSPFTGEPRPNPPELSSGSSNVGTASGQPRPYTPSARYYEDVDPRFSDVNVDPSAPPPSAPPNQPILPRSLTPGGASARHMPPTRDFQTPPSDEHLQDGARSPTGSDTSHFTSVSQRGVNPRWGPGSEEMRAMPLASMRKPIPPGRDRDVLLQNNPDFEIPGMRPPGRGWGVTGAGRGGGVGGGADGGIGATTGQPGAGGGRMPPATSTNGLTGAGRYPPP